MLRKPWRVSGGTTTICSGSSSTTSSPTVQRPRPRRRRKTSWYGWTCSSTARPGGVFVTNIDASTPPRAAPSNRKAVGDTASADRSSRRSSGTLDMLALLQPFGRVARVQVDVDLAQRARAGVGEAVRHAGGNDHHVAGARDDLALPRGHRRLALLDDEHLVVVVAVQARPAARGSVDEDQRDAGVAV